MRRAFVPFAAVIVAATLLATSCVRVKAPASQPSAAVPGASLWVEPDNIAAQDLYYGPWGEKHAPDPDAVYTLIELKHSGVNLGMDVRDPQGREWSVKQPFPGAENFEGPVEVALSRLLSAVGYHQPPVYFLPAFKLKDDFGTRIVPGGRFRLDHPDLDREGAWSWQENPFIGTKPFKGLLVLMMMFGNTDLKNSNNSLYERQRGDLVEEWYVARDLGAALGDSHRFSPRKGDPAAFEREPFILGVSNGYVDFGYRGWYRTLVENRITPDDAAWASNLLAQLTDQQWADAFRAAGYKPEVAQRFIRTLRAKVEQGQNVMRQASAQ